MPHLAKARYGGDYRVWLEFSDGASGEVDFAPELHGKVFEPLRDLAYFREFRLDEELGTLVWPNGADFAPEFLYEQVSVHA